MHFDYSMSSGFSPSCFKMPKRRKSSAGFIDLMSDSFVR